MADIPVTVVISWTVSRETDNPTALAIATGKFSGEIPPNDINRSKLVAMINGSAESNETTAKITGIFPKFIRVANTGKATIVKQLSRGKHKSGSTKDYNEALAN